MTLLRKHRNWLMAVIAILAIPFIFYFNKSDFGRSQQDHFATIYGKDVSRTEAMRSARLCNLARELGMQNLVRSLAVGANSEDQLYAQFTINRIILHHEAESLGIKPSAREITDFVRTLRPFRNATGFDPKKFDEFTQTVLPSMGFDEANIEDLVSDELALNRIKEIVTAGVNVIESQSKSEYEQFYGKMQVSYVRLRASDFAKSVTVNDEDIRKYYDAHKAQLKTDEKRKVEFVSLTLTDEQKKLGPKERIEPLQKLADQAEKLSAALQEKDAKFDDMAKNAKLPVQATDEFTADAPDPKLKSAPELGAVAFQLTTDNPVSDVVQTPDGFYVLHLVSSMPSRPLTLEEAKPKIVESITASRAREMLASKGAQISHDLREALASGTPLAAATAKLGVQTEKLEPFTLSEEMEPEEAAKQPTNRPPDFVAIRNAAASLQPGEVSEYEPADEGGIIAVLEKRELPDETKFAQKRADFERRILNNKREIVFYEWLHDRQQEAGISFARNA